MNFLEGNMKSLFFVLLSIGLLGQAVAAERDHEVSVGGGIGVLPASPFAQPAFSNTVDFFGTRASLWGRFHMAYPGPGLEISADRLDFAGSKLQADAWIASAFWRFLPAETFHPVFAFGGGIAMTKNFFTSGDRDLAVYRLRAGLEYELNPQFELGAYLDHYTIFPNKKSEPAVQALSPTIAINYFFRAPGAPAPEKK